MGERMVRMSGERVLLIGDTRREVQSALMAALPGAEVTSVGSVFEGIAELTAHVGNGAAYTTVVAAAAPIERRPESAVRTLRELSGTGRIVLFGAPAFEPLSRKMLPFGCNDFLMTPATPEDVQEILGGPQMRLADDVHPAEHDSGNGHSTQQPDDGGSEDHASGAGPWDDGSADEETIDDGPSEDGTTGIKIIGVGAEPIPQQIRRPALTELPLVEVLLEALLQQPHNCLAAAVQQVNGAAAGRFELLVRNRDEAAPVPAAEQQLLSVSMGGAEPSVADKPEAAPAMTLHLTLAADEDSESAQHALADFSRLLSKVAALQERHNRLQRLAITDELTGVYNGRYFRHFLTRILERARKMHFPVTLLLFDIDDFKQYNDQFGHGVGDEILKQTATMMKRCTREHDLVARIGGDEFAVVFWDKEGPRQPREPRPGNVSRPPQSPRLMFERFKTMMAGDQFTALGQSGKGVLGVSAGLAVYPYDAPDACGLIKEADRALMQGAKKKTGKNSIYIVGTDDPDFLPAQP